MKGNKKVIDKLNAYLAEELTAISQYIVHAEMCENWGYGKLHDLIRKRAIQEMKHAEKLISRILFLEGKPEVSKLNKMMIGATVEEQFANDLDGERDAVKEYNEGIRFCVESGDNGTAELLKANLAEEEKHLDWLQAQLEQIGQVGAGNYLMQQV